MTHLIDDETVAKMGHPVVEVRLDVGHPVQSGEWLTSSLCVPFRLTREDLFAAESRVVMDGNKLFRQHRLE